MAEVGSWPEEAEDYDEYEQEEEIQTAVPMPDISMMNQCPPGFGFHLRGVKKCVRDPETKAESKEWPRPVKRAREWENPSSSPGIDMSMIDRLNQCPEGMGFHLKGVKKCVPDPETKVAAKEWPRPVKRVRSRRSRPLGIDMSRLNQCPEGMGFHKPGVKKCWPDSMKGQFDRRGKRIPS